MCLSWLFVPEKSPQYNFYSIILFIMLFRVRDKISSLKNRKLAEVFTDTYKIKANCTNWEHRFSDSLIKVHYLPTRSCVTHCMLYVKVTGHSCQLKTYLNLTSLHKHSITVAPPKECPIIAILHKSMEFWNAGRLFVISTPQNMIEQFSILTKLTEF